MNSAKNIQRLFRSGFLKNPVRNASQMPKEHEYISIPFPPGAKQMQQAKNWVSSGAIFGATGFGLLCYFTDWKVIVAYIPFYRGKFQE